MAAKHSQPQLQAFISMTEPRHLLEKLAHDYQRLVSAKDTIGPHAQYAAFDFFVTAEHMCDWLEHALHGTNPARHRQYQDGKIVWDVASGAKHFRADRDRGHDTAKGTRAHRGSFSAGAFSRDSFDVTRLVVDLEDGKTADVLDVAERVLAHWRETIK